MKPKKLEIECYKMRKVEGYLCKRCRKVVLAKGYKAKEYFRLKKLRLCKDCKAKVKDRK